MGLVNITTATYDNIHERIETALEGGAKLNIHDGEKIVIKINLCDLRMPETGAVTHPVFLAATLNYLRSNFNRLDISVVESDATCARPDYLIKWLGLMPVIEKYEAKYVNLSKEPTSVVPIKGRHFKAMKVPKIILDADCFISMSKMKTHMLTKITCSLKNQFGCIPVTRKIKFHPYLDDVIVDANLAMKPDFCIVDGILGMGGVKGPEMGVPLNSKIVVTGDDPVSVDSVCSKIMGFNPYFVGHVRKAGRAGIGSMSYKLTGEPLNRKDFEFNHLYDWTLKFVMSLRS
jgi:uncharacterized protein (DUF362 family)